LHLGHSYAYLRRIFHLAAYWLLLYWSTLSPIHIRVYAVHCTHNTYGQILHSKLSSRGRCDMGPLSEAGARWPRGNCGRGLVLPPGPVPSIRGGLHEESLQLAEQIWPKVAYEKLSSIEFEEVNAV
jgi:hypothetical protein